MSANCHDGQGMEEVNGGGSGGAATSSAAGNTGFMLFGVRVMEGSSSFRKSVSMTNLGQYEQPHDSNADVAAGYASDDVVHSSARNRERKRGVPWTEEEHKLFLLGLQKVGKGDWRGISRNFVKTRTPTQVASHAQKYFLRRNNHNRRRRRRSSLFDITTDTFVVSAMEDKVHQETISPRKLGSNNLQGTLVPNFPVTLSPIILPIPEEDSIDDALTLGHGNQLTDTPKLIRPISIPPLPPPSSNMADLNLNQTTSPEPLPLALKLSPPSSSSDQQSQASRHPSTFQAISGSFNGSSGDSRISVA